MQTTSYQVTKKFGGEKQRRRGAQAQEKSAPGFLGATKKLQKKINFFGFNERMQTRRNSRSPRRGVRVLLIQNEVSYPTKAQDHRIARTTTLHLYYYLRVHGLLPIVSVSMSMLGLYILVQRNQSLALFVFVIFLYINTREIYKLISLYKLTSIYCLLLYTVYTPPTIVRVSHCKKTNPSPHPSPSAASPKL